MNPGETVIISRLYLLRILIRLVWHDTGGGAYEVDHLRSVLLGMMTACRKECTTVSGIHGHRIRTGCLTCET